MLGAARVSCFLFWCRVERTIWGGLSIQGEYLDKEFFIEKRDEKYDALGCFYKYKSIVYKYLF